MNLQKLKEKTLWQIKTNRYRKNKINGLKRKLEVVEWMLVDWGNPPYDTSGSLKIKPQGV